MRSARGGPLGKVKGTITATNCEDLWISVIHVYLLVSIDCHVISSFKSEFNSVERSVRSTRDQDSRASMRWNASYASWDIQFAFLSRLYITLVGDARDGRRTPSTRAIARTDDTYVSMVKRVVCIARLATAAQSAHSLFVRGVDDRVRAQSSLFPPIEAIFAIIERRKRSSRRVTVRRLPPRQKKQRQPERRKKKPFSHAIWNQEREISPSGATGVISLSLYRLFHYRSTVLK